MMKQILMAAFLISWVACDTPKALMSKSELKKENYQEIKGFYDEKGSKTGKPDTYPMYAGGLNGLLKSAGAILEYPEEAQKKGIKGPVIVKYVINTEGVVKDVTVVKSAHPILDKEAVRVVKSLTKWYPGFKNGKPTKVEFKQPFEF
jgi:periplasmic protein TonB